MTQEFVGVEDIKVEVSLTDEQKARMAEELSSMVGRMEKLEADKKAFDAGINSQLKMIEAESRDLAEVIRVGTTEENIRAEVWLDPESRTAEYRREENGEVVKVREMTKEELQRPLFQIEHIEIEDEQVED